MVKRIGILTLPLSINFGGIMQAVTLGEYLKRQGYEVTLLDKRRPMTAGARAALFLLERIPFQNLKGVRRTFKARRMHARFIDRHIATRTPVLRSERELMQAVDHYELDAVIVGSDQVWRMDYLAQDGYKEFFLSFVKSPLVRRIAYAASFGTGEWLHTDRTPVVSSLLQRFHAVSTREASGVEICAKTFDVENCEHVLDPTLLIDPQFYQDVASAGANDSGANFLTYLLDAPDRRPLVEAASRALPIGYRQASLRLEQDNPPDLPTWVRSFRDADFVMTDSYHGTIFSVIFGKPFIAIANTGRGADRFVSLLTQLGLSERLIALDEVHKIAGLVATPIDYSEVQKRLVLKRQLSAGFLQRALGQ